MTLLAEGADGGPNDGWETVTNPTEAHAAIQSGADKGPVTLSGPAFLSTLDPGMAAQVKAVGQYDMPLPPASRAGGIAIQQAVARAYPEYDYTNAHSKVAAAKAFTSGKQGQNINSLNTALAHLGTTAQRAEDLKNESFTPYNSIANAAGRVFGDPRVTNFNVARQAVADELTRAFRGSGGNVADIKGWEDSINSSESPEQLRGAIQQGAKLLEGRVYAIGDQRSQALGTKDDPLSILNPHARAALAAFQSPDYASKGYQAIAATLGHDPPPGGPPSGPGGDGGPPPPGDAPPASGGPTIAGPGSGSGGPAPAAPSAPAPATMALSADGSTDMVASRDKAVAAEAQKLLDSGAPRSAFDALSAKYGIPAYDGDLDKALAYRDKGGKGATILPAHTNTGPSIMGAIANSGVGSAATGFADTATFGLLPKGVAATRAVLDKAEGDQRSFGDVYGNDLADAHAQISARENAHPLAALGGSAAGFIAGDGVLSAVPGIAKLAGKLPSIIRPAAGDALFGAATGLGSSDHLADIPGGVLRGSALSVAGGVLGRGVAKTVGALASPVANAAVRRLTDAGVTLTPGQILGAGGGVLGRAVKGLEDKATSFSGVGDAINATRHGSVEDFNLAALNEHLGKSGEALPTGMKAGFAANKAAVDTADRVYADALAPLRLPMDGQLSSDLSATATKVSRMGDGQQKDFGNMLDEHVAPYLPKNGEPLTGENLQNIKQGLDGEIATYRKSTAPNDQKLADRLSEVRDSYLSLADRAAPAEAEAYRNARATYGGIQTFVNAAQRTKEGVVTPAQYLQAVQKLGYGTTKRGLATGTAPNQQLAVDASTVLPSAIADSGTAGRLGLGLLGARLSGGAALGGAEGYRESGATGALTGALVGGALLSRPGAKVLQYGLAGSRGKTLNTLGDFLRRNAALSGAVGAPLLLNRRAQ